MVSDKDDTYSDEETARRRDEALRRALNTPPKPKPKPSGQPKKPENEPWHGES